MRILLTSHFPLARLGSGLFVRDLGRGLIEAGNEVQCLCTGTEPTSAERFPVETLICSSDTEAADLSFDLPDFLHRRTGEVTFGEMTDDQISNYREVFRRRLDSLVDRYNPDIIHGQHIGLQGELILETGVPYVLTAHWSELVTFDQDSRIRALALQAAENAGRILVGSEWLRDRWRQTLDEPADQFQVIPNAILWPWPPDLNSASSVSVSKPTLGESRPQVLFIGDPATGGGTEVFLNAAARLASSGQPLSIRILGHSSQHELTKLQAGRLGLADVNCFEPNDDADVLRIQDTDLVMLEGQNEISEAIGLQALSTGSFVVCATMIGFEHPVDDLCCLHVPAGDHELLGDAITRALEMDSGQHKIRSERVLGRHSVDVTIPQVVAIYESVLRQRFGQK